MLKIREEQVTTLTLSLTQRANRHLIVREEKMLGSYKEKALMSRRSGVTPNQRKRMGTPVPSMAPDGTKRN
jgi:hypothetical protein